MTISGQELNCIRDELARLLAAAIDQRKIVSGHRLKLRLVTTNDEDT